MLSLDELKEWIRVDGEDEDNTLSSLLISSKMIIKQATGVVAEDVVNNTEATELYKLIQNIIITDLYENRSGSEKINPGLTSLYVQLEAYKLRLAITNGETI